MGVEWNDNYRIGIDTIDEQHKGFFTIFNSILKEKKRYQLENMSKDNKIKLYWHLFEIRKYALTHFIYEEECMLEYKYVRFFSHKADHDKFIIDIINMEESMIKKGNIDIVVFIDYITNWLKTHIVGSDRLFGKFVLSGSVLSPTEPPIGKTGRTS